MKFYLNHSLKKKVNHWEIAVYKWLTPLSHLNEYSFDSVVPDGMCKSLDLPDHLC